MLEKVKVSNEVLEVINRLRDKSLNLDFIMRAAMNQTFTGENSCLNAYELDELVLIWKGHYELGN